MKSYKLDQMIKGWFIGNFEPCILKTTEFEVGVKKYKTGDKDTKHHHKQASEISVVASGKISMCGKVWCENDIIFLSPGDSTDFEALEDSIVVVVKIPSIIGDKFFD